LHRPIVSPGSKRASSQLLHLQSLSPATEIVKTIAYLLLLVAILSGMFLMGTSKGSSLMTQWGLEQFVPEEREEKEKRPKGDPRRDFNVAELKAKKLQVATLAPLVDRGVSILNAVPEDAEPTNPSLPLSGKPLLICMEGNSNGPAERFAKTPSIAYLTADLDERLIPESSAGEIGVVIGLRWKGIWVEDYYPVRRGESVFDEPDENELVKGMAEACEITVVDARTKTLLFSWRLRTSEPDWEIIVPNGATEFYQGIIDPRVVKQINHLFLPTEYREDPILKYGRSRQQAIDKALAERDKRVEEMKKKQEQNP